MSSPHRSLKRATRCPNGKHSARMVVTHTGIERQKTILRSNMEEEQMQEASWSPPEAWMTDVADFITTKDNYGWRKNRAVMTLRYLLTDTGELMENPSQYIHDIWWFRYLSSSKHLKIENPLASQADFIRLGLPKLFKGFWSEHLCITDIEQWKNVKKESVEALYHMSMALWFISSNPIHQQQMYDELAQFVLTMISSQGFSRYFPKVKRVQDCLKALLGIIYQFSKSISSAMDLVRANDGIKILQWISSRRSNFNRNIKGRAHMILARVMNEEEQKGSDTAESIIAFLVGLLRDCLKADDHRSTVFNYDALEILDGLNRLAMSDSNKIKINDNDGLPLYLDLLKSCTLVEQEEACKGLWTLCFCELVAENVSQDSIMMSVLQSLAKSKHETLKIAACGCLWTVQKLKDANQIQSAVHKAGHVMISYNWSVQAEAKQLKDKLHNSGYRVWMDIENMSGSTLSAMSQAIERSTVVLMLLSERYKTSPACRAEAEYAYKLDREIIPLRIQPGYSPDGWLGMVIGMKLSFDLSDQSMNEYIYEDLINVLGERGKGPPIADKDEVDKPVKVQQPQQPAESKQSIEKVTIDISPLGQHTVHADLECMNWNEVLISGWIEKNKLQELATGLGDITGDILTELRFMLLSETEHYYRLIRTDLKLPSLLILRLSAALRRLK